MWLRAVECDRVARSDLVSVEPNRDLKSPSQDIAVLRTVMPHQGMRRGRLAPRRIAQVEEVYVVIRLRREPLPCDTGLEADRRSALAALDG